MPYIVSLASASLPSLIAGTIHSYDCFVKLSKQTLQFSQLVFSGANPTVKMVWIYIVVAVKGRATLHDPDDIFDQLSEPRATPRRDKSEETAIILLTR